MMAIATVVSMGLSSYDASAASDTPADMTVKPSDLTVDYVNQKITVKDSSYNSKIYVAKATVTVKKVKGTDKEITTVKTGAASEYDLVNSDNKWTGTIDISPYSPARDTYLSIWGNTQRDPILVKLPATNMKMKAVVDAVNTTVTMNDITDKKHPFPVEPVEYCTSNGKWIDYEADKTDLTGYTVLGATLRFRIKAQGNMALSNTAQEIGTDVEGNPIKVYTTDWGNFASNEFKVRIPKKANGPKATFDYVNHLIKVPKNCEYRVQSPGALGKFTAVSGDTKTVTLKADDLTMKGDEFDIRVAATDKKPASKITEYHLGYIPTVVAQTSQGKYFNTTDQNVMDSRIMDPYGPMTGGVEELLDFQVTKLTYDPKSKNGTMTMTVKNGTMYAYQFIVADSQMVDKVSDLKLPALTDKVTGTVAAGKTASIKVRWGQYVYIRMAANVRNQQWSSPYVFFGQVMDVLE